VLVVDDDDQVRELAVSVLEDFHYTVFSASCADEALAILDRGHHVDLLFTDIVMPGRDGYALADVAKERRPALRVLYTSGYVRAPFAPPHGPLLAKPWRPAQLAAAVRRALLPEPAAGAA
jgi:CheY-like chemotaxis protein